MFIGAIVVFVKLENYSWWLIGSWKGVLVVLAVLGLGVLLTNIGEMVKLVDASTYIEVFLWIVAATVVIASLYGTTTIDDFVASVVFIGLVWAAQFFRHVWDSSQTHNRQHVPVH